MTSSGLGFATCPRRPSLSSSIILVSRIVLFFLIGDPTVLYFCVNLILFLLTALFKIVVMLFMATEQPCAGSTGGIKTLRQFTSSQGLID